MSRSRILEIGDSPLFLIKSVSEEIRKRKGTVPYFKAR